jgi:aryl-alcohol dehydrogenase-like predicted oxidoreductase
MPRFQPANFAANEPLRARYLALAGELGCTPAQLALAWLLAKAPHVIAIPGMRSIGHLDDDLGADAVVLDVATVKRLDDMFRPGAVVGARYVPATQAEVDTEEFAEASA